MTEFNPSEQFDDQLLSAYVDGELTDDERALVDERLANDPLAQQMVDELRVLSQEVQALPTETVGEDLRASIMQRAERAMLLGEATTTLPDSPPSSASRRLFWAAAALAATLLLSIYLPNDQDANKPVASAKPLPEEPGGQDSQFRALEVEDAESVDVAPKGRDVPQPEVVGRSEAEQTLAEMPATEFEAAREGKADNDAIVSANAPQLHRYRKSEPKALSDTANKAAAPPALPSFAAMDAEPELALNAVQDRQQLNLSCEVHITLRDDDQSVQRFDEMLTRSGIAFEERNQQAAGDAGALAGGPQGELRQSQAAQAEPTDAPKELVLVEAPIENIENALKECNLDTFTCPSIRVVADKESTTPAVQRLEQWSRNGQQVVASDAIAARAVQQSREQDGEATTLGRATRLRTEDFDDSPDGKQWYFRRGLLEKDNRDKLAGQTPLQILFVLQRATTNPVPSPQPAAVSPAEH